jgi:prolyl 4-hydroxylase
MQLAECSLYGIRIYKEGAVLASHVDRLPLVSSAIINVDQDLDEPWPLEVIGHDGVAVNVTMEPGDLVLYESHSILHGRPFPLKGRFMANVFIHFEPVGPVGKEIEIDEDLPMYIVHGSEEERNWRMSNPNGYKVQAFSNVATTGMTRIHEAAQTLGYKAMRKLLKDNRDLVNARDGNGWMPIHDAIRSGNIEAIQALVDSGADINARTKGASSGSIGGSPLWWALYYHSEDHDIVDYLVKLGAKSFAPDGKDEL